MEVIKYGKIQPRIFTCPHCEAKIKVLDNEMVFREVWVNKKRTFGFNCPVCYGNINQTDDGDYIYSQNE